MNSVKRFLNKIPFVSYFKRIDPKITDLLSAKNVKTIPVILTFHKPLEPQLESRLKRAGFKLKYHLPFMNAATGKVAVNNFDSVSSFVEISKIYFDGTACLMGDATNNGSASAAVVPPALQLTGKGIAAAFIDSGVFPHPDLVKPRNRLVAFKDFISGLEEPYDDNGHGTGCIGASFGASTDGKFKTAAYDCSIVCAKAFNKLGYGSYSDILAAMQWICTLREKHNIRVMVLPFGCLETHKSFDIMSSAAESLWNGGIFVSACSGNLGPREASITSPGVSSWSFTTGACTNDTKPPQVVPFSGRGPVPGKYDKPDAVMPGFRVTTLNTDTGYFPGNMSQRSNFAGQHYTEISGSSVAAGMTAAAAVLLYQKKPELSPTDAKNILKRLCTSINELKTAQGAGMIDIKKIEEL